MNILDGVVKKQKIVKGCRYNVVAKFFVYFFYRILNRTASFLSYIRFYIVSARTVYAISFCCMLHMYACLCVCENALKWRQQENCSQMLAHAQVRIFFLLYEDYTNKRQAGKQLAPWWQDTETLNDMTGRHAAVLHSVAIRMQRKLQIVKCAKIIANRKSNLWWHW